MHHVTALIRCQPEQTEAVGTALAQLAQASRDEAGCIAYELYRPSTPGLFITHEIWADREAEKAHMKGAPVAALLAAAGQYLAGPPEIHRC
ncbi:MAG TPA: putative quinol monooxygenase, partial [Rhodocyclaceae bacterium]|nr:putative quinol monooxygenase [Rhodocyclaceae bacterium]